MLEQLKENWIVFVPILGVTITASIAYLVGRPRWYAKLDEQYQKVFAPLHQLLTWFDGSEEERNQKIEEILRENYHLVSQDTLTAWNYGNTGDFMIKVAKDFRYAAKRLGYEKVRQPEAIFNFVLCTASAGALGTGILLLIKGNLFWGWLLIAMNSITGLVYAIVDRVKA